MLPLLSCSKASIPMGQPKLPLSGLLGNRRI